MKIGLNVSGTNDPAAQKAAEGRVLENLILKTKKGDWEAKDILIKRFLPLITSLAEKRTTDQAELNKLVEAGKDGLVNAAKKYKPAVGPDKFRIFALDYIEGAMDGGGAGGGFLSKLFGKK